VNGNGKSTNRISEHDAAIILETLTARARDGLSMRDAFERVPMSVDTYYRRKDKFPDEIEEIERQAEAAGRRERLEMMDHSTYRQILNTIALRDSAAELLLRALPYLKRILTEDGYTVTDHEGKERFVVIYPRDVIAAVKVMQELAQFGTLPDGALPQSEQDEPPLPALPPPPAHFRTIALPPGTKVDIETPEVIDGEVEVLT